MHLPVKNKPGGVENLLAWFKDLLVQIQIGPLFTLTSMTIAVLAIIAGVYRFEVDNLTKQLAENQAKSEDALREIQNKIEERIPERVRSPLPIFPKNDISLVLRSNQPGMTLELEWADRDRKHRYQYLVQVVCIAEIEKGKSSNNHEEESTNKSANEAHCDANNLGADIPDVVGNFYWTQPGVDTVEVPIKDTGTYAWRVARGERDGNGKTTIFGEWSPYFIFTVFESINQRVEVMNEVIVGIVEGSTLQEKRAKAKKEEKASMEEDVASKEQRLVDHIQGAEFKGKELRYRSYPTYEALIEAVVRGEVDYAIGEITRANYREQLGVFFTRGYHDASPLFISKSSRTQPPEDGDTIGVVSGSATDQALTPLAESKRFRIEGELLPRDLIKDLKKGTVDFIFSANEAVKNLRNPRDSNKPPEFKAHDPHGELREFYRSQLGYPPEFAIATIEEKMCRKLDMRIEAALLMKDKRYPNTLFQGNERPCSKG